MKCFKTTKDIEEYSIDELLDTLSSTEKEEATKLANSEEFELAKDMLDFLEIETGEFIAEYKTAKDIMADILSKLRDTRLGTDSKVEEYKSRTLTYLADSINMEIENAIKKEDKTNKN